MVLIYITEWKYIPMEFALEIALKRVMVLLLNFSMRATLDSKTQDMLTPRMLVLQQIGLIQSFPLHLAKQI